MQTKKELRDFWINHRMSLTEAQKNERSFLIQEQFLEHFGIAKAEYIHIFLPVNQKCEVRTWALIQYLAEKYPHVYLCAPRIRDASKGLMDSVAIEKNTRYVRNKWGIDEPETGHIVPPELLDMVLLPLLVFDKQGHRLGYGGGFYDRYLPQCTKALKIGLSYFEPVPDIPETQPYDIPMNYCITPERIYRFYPTEADNFVKNA